jgi:hypothetical protein
MLDLLADHDLTDVIVDGVRQYCPTLNIGKARDVGLQQTGDDGLLEWAVEQSRIVFSHDRLR